jgi:putative MATE family efflux protein
MNLSFFRDRAFFRVMLTIAVPVAFQQLITASLNMIDVLMVGQLGEASIAALGLANQVFFVLILFLFGITSGMAIFTAQYWGRRDTDSIIQILSICLIVSVIAGTLFTLAATLIPETILGFYTADPKVIELGSGYLRIVGLSYVPMAIATAYIAVLRSMEKVRLTVIVTVLALIVKTGLGYLLIFGLFGLPALGVVGAAIATCIAWAFAISLLITLVYALKTPLAVHPRQLFQFNFSKAFLFKVLRTSMPAAANEIAWSLGITTYNAVYAHIGTDAIAAINISATIEDLTYVVFMGLGSACAVMVGNQIGAGDKDAAHEYARRFLIMGILSSIVLGLLIIPLRDPLIGLYALSPQGTDSVRWLLLTFSLTAWLRVHNFMLFVGALRAGGDTRFALIMELLSIWLIGVPAALIGGFVLHLPVYGVYWMVLLEEAVKAVVISWRFRSKKWIHDLVNAPA